jgi:phosphoglycolate phosphatase
MRFSCIVFDLDSTMVDTSASLTVACNELLASRGLPTVESEQIRKLDRQDPRSLLRSVFGLAGSALSDAELTEQLERFEQLYDSHLLELTRPCPDARRVMQTLSERQVKLSVLTNKPRQSALKILEHFSLARYLDYLVSGDMGLAQKPDPAGLLEIMEKSKVEADKTLMVGNRRFHLLAARNAGVKSACCMTFTDRVTALAMGTDYVLTDLEQLVDLVTRRRTSGVFAP